MNDGPKFKLGTITHPHVCNSCCPTGVKKKLGFPLQNSLVTTYVFGIISLRAKLHKNRVLWVRAHCNSEKVLVYGWKRCWKGGLNSPTYGTPQKWECPTLDHWGAQGRQRIRVSRWLTENAVWAFAHKDSRHPRVLPGKSGRILPTSWKLGGGAHKWQGWSDNLKLGLSARSYSLPPQKKK